MVFILSVDMIKQASIPLPTLKGFHPDVPGEIKYVTDVYWVAVPFNTAVEAEDGEIYSFDCSPFGETSLGEFDVTSRGKYAVFLDIFVLLLESFAMEGGKSAA